MSRNIMTSKSEETEEEKKIRNTNNGKLIFTEYKDKKCALLISGNRLLATHFFAKQCSKIGAIYIGKIKNVVKNIDAYFVEIENKEICFLPGKDIQTPCLLNRTYDGRLLEGDEILVQITRDPQKTKQASVTTNISVSNPYFALGIGSPKIGYSNKISKKKKELLQDILLEHHILCPSGLEERFTNHIDWSIGLVIRTQATELLENVDTLIDYFQGLWDEFSQILQFAKHRACFSCLKRPESNIESVLHNLVYPNEFEEIITDSEDTYQELKNLAQTNTYHLILQQINIRYYQDEKLSLQALYSIDAKMDTALNTHIWLKSGGYLIIEQTEALTVIDVNSGKYEPKKTSFEAQYNLNIEACAEIALQMRLRNMSGIIIVDFINMETEEMKESLLNEMKKYTEKDKIKTAVVDITALGLMEITRKKTTKTLNEQFLLS